MLRKIIYLITIIMFIIAGCTNNETTQNRDKETPRSLENLNYNGDQNINKNGETNNSPNISLEKDPETKQKDGQQEPQQNEKPEERDVKGIYLNRNSIKEENIEKYIELVKSSNLNAVVIDIKDDFGKLSYDSTLDSVNEIGSDNDPTVDLKKLLQRLKEEDIYTIGRIVTFKDPFLAEQKNEYAMKRKDGSVWSDAAGVKWIDPHKKEVWEYVTDIAAEVASFGIDEIQYDYIRFPENAKKVDQEVAFDNPNQIKKSETIRNFLRFSKEKLDHHPIYISADVFGLVTSAKDDMGIGQSWEKIAPLIDYISPMTYPSHYAPNTYGIENPDRQPYDLMKKAMQDANDRNNKLEDPAIIRPWIQDFDYKSNYTIDDVKNQIKALEEENISQYLFWNAKNEYTEAAFM